MCRTNLCVDNNVHCHDFKIIIICKFRRGYAYDVFSWHSGAADKREFEYEVQCQDVRHKPRLLARVAAERDILNSWAKIIGSIVFDRLTDWTASWNPHLMSHVLPLYLETRPRCWRGFLLKSKDEWVWKVILLIYKDDNFKCWNGLEVTRLTSSQLKTLVDHSSE